ncbi:hypothetical protein KBP46_10045 [Chryseobacterium sp. PCH239]|uniref:hypothetical protein n=1 Tax=Chryseobacterium sp. PCH239 TaxID=2825845 RepID=UPI001C11FBF8|nr:hypothetical protein [Chryseobacterium sp. PCH239]QWT88137.1 hypothetical protein KBP46_10045 [Chryseobacterium sp. PCH239]
MSHQEKQEIFDQYARLKGFGSWRHLLQKAVCDGQMTVSELKDHIFDACDLVQAEQQKRIAKNMNWDRCKNKGSECRTDKHERSILNPENKIS